MKSMLVPLCVALAIVAHVFGHSEEKVWENYEAIHNEHLLDVFRSKESLYRANHLAEHTSEAEKVLRYVCGPYRMPKPGTESNQPTPSKYAFTRLILT
jgi:hypothetical protein